MEMTGVEPVSKYRFDKVWLVTQVENHKKKT